MTRFTRLSMWASVLPIVLAVAMTALFLAGAPTAAAAPREIGRLQQDGPAVVTDTAKLAPPVDAKPIPGGAPLPMAPTLGCTLAGSVRTCELWVVTGTLTLPDAAVIPIWGYSTSSTPGSAELPGPTLEAVTGETMQVILHNTLPFNTSLTFYGQGLTPDYAGIGQGGTVTYTFAADQPGTFFYEPGLSPDANRQRGMGMYGALIIRPAANPNWAYDDAATAFDSEALLLVSEIDPEFHADPMGYSIQHYEPKYWLINGKAYPQTENIVVTPTQTTLLRFVNVGYEAYSIELLGMHQSVIGRSGVKLPYAFNVVAENFAAGETMDTLVTISAGTAAGSKFPLLDGSVGTHNNGQVYGGMLTFLEVQGALPAPGLPTTENVSALPSPTTDTAPVTVTAVVTSVNAGGAPITAAEFFIDSLGADGTGTAMTATDAAFDSATEAVEGVISPAVLGTLANGPHIVYVHGQTAGGWGPVSSIPFLLDRFGPDGYDAVLVYPQSNGTKDVDARATVFDVAGLGTVIAEYFIDAPGANGTGTPMDITPPGAYLASIDTTILSSTIAALSEGPHLIYMHAQDTLGNWGQYVTATLKVDKTGPTASVGAAPNPTSGLIGVNSTQFVMRVTASINDPVAAGVNSNVVRAELFINPPITHTCGETGYRLMARDVLFDETSEVGYVDVPLGDIRWFADGTHALKICALDAAGNWASGTGSFVVDKTGPAINSLAVSPNPAVFQTILTANASDAHSPIAAAEWFVGNDPGVGLGNPAVAVDGNFNSTSENVNATINVTTWLPGNYTVCLRARDAIGNWTATPVCTTLTVDRIFADGFESGDFSAWSAVNGSVQITTSNVIHGAYSMGSPLSGTTYQGYVQDNTPNAETTYRARFYFNPGGTTTGGQANRIFGGLNSAGTSIFRVEAGTSSAGGHRIRIWMQTATGGVTGGYVVLPNAPTSVEIAWQSGVSGSMSLWINGTLRTTITGNTAAYTLDTARLGPQLVGSLSNGRVYFDSFVSSRDTYIGP